MNSRSGSLIRVGALLAPLALSCSELYAPFRDPNAPVIPSFADSAFGSGATKWFASRTFDSVMAVHLDAQSVYAVEAKAATNSLVAINITNGAGRWSKPVPSLSHHIVSVAGVAAAVGQGVVAFNATTGDSQFVYAPAAGRSVTSNAATDGTSIIVGNAAGEIVGLNPTTGVEAWKVTVDTASVKGVTASAGIAYAGGNGFLVAITISTGAQSWKRVTTDSPRPHPDYAPAVDSGRVTIQTLSGASFGMANYDATTGVFSWAKGSAYPTQPLEAPGQPACGGVVTSYSPTSIDALAFATGTVAWSRGLSAYNLLSSSCAFGTVLVNARRGTAGAWYNDVEILNAPDGAVKATFPKTVGQQLRVHRVVRNGSAIYFFTATGISAILAP